MIRCTLCGSLIDGEPRKDPEGNPYCPDTDCLDQVEDQVDPLDEYPTDEDIHEEEKHEADKYESDDDVCPNCGEEPDADGVCGCGDGFDDIEEEE